MLFNDASAKKCRKCHAKRPDDVIQAPPPLTKKPDQIIDAWAADDTPTGTRELTEDEQRTKDRKENIESLIEGMKKLGGQEEAIKGLEAELRKLKNHDLVNSTARDNVSLAKSVQQAEEEGARKLAAAEQRL